MLDRLRRRITALISPIVIIDDFDFDGIVKLIQAPNFQRRNAGVFRINREVGWRVSQDPRFLQPSPKTADLNQIESKILNQILILEYAIKKPGLYINNL